MNIRIPQRMNRLPRLFNAEIFHFSFRHKEVCFGQPYVLKNENTKNETIFCVFIFEEKNIVSWRQYTVSKAVETMTNAIVN